MTLIGLLSDVHATPGPVAEALAIFRERKVDRIYCVGDVAGYGRQLEETVNLLRNSGCITILGNHELIYLDRFGGNAGNSVTRYFRQLPDSLDLTIEGKRIYLVHAQPPFSCRGGIKLLDQQGRVQEDQKDRWSSCLAAYGYDVLIVGHTHQVFAERLGRTLVVNPGSSAFNHTCAILSLPQLDVELFALSNKQPIRSWNWSQQRDS